MGFEMTVVETDVNINLSDLYRVKDAVEEAFDWYLGSDIKAKLDKFIALQTKASKLTYDEVLSTLVEKFGEDSDEVSMFKSILFASMSWVSFLLWITDSIKSLVTNPPYFL